ncbi:tRNA-binding protein [Blastopirellula retiformator]|uniref:tRNA-binding protein YgjH n=1 Tax=Blastopirellula retiformator TaxID=2527970 RepID=A0A5C5VLL6_9BACT|nr:tRNA-binding protein [Blastopirellula retiformator]TWT38840.1 tRNA-binding protein YgjH [Blastopirellula retiformator]
MSNSPTIAFADLTKIDIRVGRIVSAAPFPEGKSSTHILQIDFGEELGVKKSLARLAPNYGFETLVDRQILAVVNLAPRQIGNHRSEVLTLGLNDANGNVVLIVPDTAVPSGNRLY